MLELYKGEPSPSSLWAYKTDMIEGKMIVLVILQRAMLRIQHFFKQISFYKLTLLYYPPFTTCNLKQLWNLLSILMCLQTYCFTKKGPSYQWVAHSICLLKDLITFQEENGDKNTFASIYILGFLMDAHRAFINKLF